MKIRQFLVITNIKDFIELGGSCNSFSLHNYEVNVDGWFPVGWVEIEAEIDQQEVTQVALTQLDEEVKRLRAQLVVVEEQKKNLLCLTHEGGE